MLGIIEFLIIIGIITFIVYPYFAKKEKEIKGGTEAKKIKNNEEDGYEEWDYEEVKE